METKVFHKELKELIDEVNKELPYFNASIFKTNCLGNENYTSIDIMFDELDTETGHLAPILSNDELIPFVKNHDVTGFKEYLINLALKKQKSKKSHIINEINYIERTFKQQYDKLNKDFGKIDDSYEQLKHYQETGEIKQEVTK